MTNKIFIAGLISVLVFLLSCSSQKLATKEDSGQKVVAEQRELIQDNIKDPEKQAKLLRIVDEVEKESQIFFKFYQEHDKRIAQLNKNFEASRQDFEGLSDDFNNQYEIYLRMLIRKRSEMRELTSKDEWTKIMDRESTFIPE